MIVLSADTSTPVNTVALLNDDRLLAETIVTCGRKHAERLVETVDWVLKEADLLLSDVQLLAISKGPGSFTGLRVGVSAWKGLALATGVPLIGVPTLDALARSLGGADGSVCTLLDAKMHEIYGAVFHYHDGVREKGLEDCVAPPSAVLTQVPPHSWFIGDGAVLYRDAIAEIVPGARFVPEYLGIPRASAVASEALELLRNGASGDAGAVNPVYLRKSQPEELRDKANVP